jgi:hypothetical protein
MKECLNRDQNDRPSFIDLQNEFEEYFEELEETKQLMTTLKNRKQTAG